MTQIQVNRGKLKKTRVMNSKVFEMTAPSKKSPTVKSKWGSPLASQLSLSKWGSARKGNSTTKRKKAVSWGCKQSRSPPTHPPRQVTYNWLTFPKQKPTTQLQSFKQHQCKSVTKKRHPTSKYHSQLSGHKRSPGPGIAPHQSHLRWPPLFSPKQCPNFKNSSLNTST